MTLKIQHGIFKSYTGSSTISTDSELVTTTIIGPSDNLKREEDYEKLTIETKVRHFPLYKPFESMTTGIVNDVLEKFVIKEADRFRSMVITIYTNTQNLSLICNSVLIACLDAGIPLKSMFYSVGAEELFIFDNNDAILYSKLVFAHEKRVKNIQEDLKYIKEAVAYAMKDVFEVE
ncbi:hypothetical protein GINT2_000637 [Glugoides intestinalis]